MPQSLSDPHRQKLDGIVGQMVANGEPDDAIQAVVEDFKGKYAAPDKPASAMEQLTAAGMNPLGTGKTWKEASREHPVENAAMVAGLTAAPALGALKFLPRLAGTVAAGAAGAGTGSLGRQAITGEKDPNLGQTMAMQGALAGIGEGAGTGLMEGGMLTGRGIYRAGVVPLTKILKKHGDIAKTGVENMVLPTMGGAVKAKGLSTAAIDEKGAALALRDRLGITHDAGAIANEAKANLAGRAQKAINAGQADPTDVMNLQPDRFAAQHPQGLPPTKLQAAQTTIDNELGGTYRKLKAKEPITAEEASAMELSQAASRAQKAVIPKYDAMNKKIMDTMGLQKAIEHRATAGMSNQWVENLLTMIALSAGHPEALAARVAMQPPVMAGLGIGAYHTAKNAGPVAKQALKALLAQLGPAGITTRPEEPIE